MLPSSGEIKLIEFILTIRLFFQTEERKFLKEVYDPETKTLNFAFLTIKPPSKAASLAFSAEEAEVAVAASLEILISDKVKPFSAFLFWYFG